MSVKLSYANNLGAIWTVPPAVEDRLQCAGRQFDALANNVNDGWACLAVSATDRLGSQQVSRPLRVCIDKDGDGAECPHKEIVAFATTPIVVQTTAAHGYNTGDVVIVSNVFNQTYANGTWPVRVLDATRFELVGSTGNVQNGTGTGGRVVLRSLLPSCTGTQTADGPPPVITNTPCSPWRLYPPGELRVPP
jgi:hypothetical protein